MRERSQSFIVETGSNKLLNLGEITWQSQGRFLLVWYGNRVTWQSIAWLYKSMKPSLDDPQQVIPVTGGFLLLGN